MGPKFDDSKKVRPVTQYSGAMKQLWTLNNPTTPTNSRRDDCYWNRKSGTNQFYRMLDPVHVDYPALGQDLSIRGTDKPYKVLPDAEILPQMVNKNGMPTDWAIKSGRIKPLALTDPDKDGMRHVVRDISVWYKRG